MSDNNYNARYKAEVAKFTKKDGIIALCYMGYVIALAFAYSIIFYSDTVHELLSMEVLRFLDNPLRPILMVAPCFIIILVRKQGLSSIGIHKKKLGFALLLGLIFSIIAQMLYIGLLPGFIQGGQLRPFGDIIVHILTITLILAAWEDIVCSGFIQPRLHGVIKNNILAVFVGALFFAVMHLPIYFVVSDASALSVFLSARTIGWIGSHIIFNLIFRKYFSIFPVIMLHTFINVAQGSLWEYPRVAGINETISFATITLAVVVWAVYQSRKSKKIV